MIQRCALRSNLKARKMAGTASEGMLLCASKREGEDLSALDLVEVRLKLNSLYTAYL